MKKNKNKFFNLIIFNNCMNKKFLFFGILVLSVFLAGCPEETGYAGMRSDGQPYSGTEPYDDPNTTYYDSGNQEYNNGNEEAAGT